MSLLGQELVPAIFGAQWASAGPLMSVLAAAGAVQSIAFFNNSMMLATGHSWLALRWTAVNAIANLAVCAVTVQFGIMAVAIGFTARAWILLPVGLYLVRRVSAVTVGQQVRTFLVPAAGCIAMAVVVVAARLVWHHDVQSVRFLGAVGGLALVIYVGIVGVLRRDIASRAIGLLRRQHLRIRGG